MRQSVQDRIHYLQVRALTLQIEVAADPTAPWAQGQLYAADACERLVAKLQQRLVEQRIEKQNDR